MLSARKAVKIQLQNITLNAEHGRAELPCRITVLMYLVKIIFKKYFVLLKQFLNNLGKENRCCC